MQRYDGLQHIVILGAGATCAALPNGDIYGRSIPAMNGFLQKTGIIDQFPDLQSEIEKYPNLEDLYSDLYNKPSMSDKCRMLNKAIFDYVASLRTSAELNIYDKLILSLTNRDCIATFNWDPFLSQAYYYMSYLTSDLPYIIFLHGNVTAGFCPDCERVGFANNICEKCHKPLLSVDLLYPIKEKNYDQNKYIREAWNQACEFIHYAERITFFGYSAPKSDVVAVNRISESLSRSPYKKIKKVEIINIDNEDKLMTSYSRLIPSCIQTNYVKSYYDSSLAKYPRRTSDYLFHTLQCNETSSLFNQYISFLERDDLFSIAKKIRAIGDMIEPWYNEHPLSKQQILMKMGIKLNGISRR